jgi:hypothetical protein
VEASIYDYEIVEETGERMNPSAPAHSKGWRTGMHTCIILLPIKPTIRVVGLRILTTTKQPGPQFMLGKLVELGNPERLYRGGSLGTWKVVGLVNIFTMNSVGKTPDESMAHWTLKS